MSTPTGFNLNLVRFSSSVAVVVAIVASVYLANQVYQPDSTRKESSSPEKFEFTQFLMGMPVTLTVYCDQRDDAEKACKAAFDRIRELVDVFSDYERNSETSRINRLPVGQQMMVSSEFVELYQQCERIYVETSKAFDPTSGEVIRLWKESRKANKLPDQDRIRAAIKNQGFESFKLIQSENQWQLRRLGDARLDFGSVAKGYIGDQVIKTLTSHGIDRGMYSAGGDVVCGNSPPDSKGWRFRFPDGTSRWVSNLAVSVSGDTEQFLVIDGKRHSHVVDPRTGQAVTNRRTCVVVAPHGVLSDALATSGCVLPPEKFRQVLRQFKQTTGQLIVQE